MDHQHHLRQDVFGGDGYPAAAQSYIVDGEIAAHTHDFVEIAVALSGNGTHLTAQGPVRFRRGAVFAVRPGHWHAYEGCVAVTVGNLYLGPELLRRDLAWVLDYPHLARLLLRGGRTIRALSEARLKSLEGWLSALTDHRSQLLNPTAGTALGLTCCALAELAAGDFDVEAPGETLSSVVRSALRLMAEDPARPWQMANLAEELHMSIPHLHRLFTRDVGTPPMTWLALTRAEQVAAQLIGTNRPITEVGRAAGWPDPSYFSRRFRALSGFTPTEYRRRFRRIRTETPQQLRGYPLNSAPPADR